MAAKVIPFHDKRNPRQPKFTSLPAVKIRLGKRKGRSYALCVQLRIVPAFDSRPPTVISMPTAKPGTEDGTKAPKTKRNRRQKWLVLARPFFRPVRSSARSEHRSRWDEIGRSRRATPAGFTTRMPGPDLPPGSKCKLGCLRKLPMRGCGR